MAFKMRGFSGFKQKKGIITTGQQKRRAEAEHKHKNVKSLLDRQNLLSTEPQKTSDILAGGPRRDPSDNISSEMMEQARDRWQGQEIRSRGVDVQVNAAMQGDRPLSRSEQEAVALSKHLEKPFKQYADKNVSVDKVSDDGRTFTGTDSKGKSGTYSTLGYDAEIMQSDSVGITGGAVSPKQMEFDMVKGTKYEQGFIDYHGKGNKPGTGKSPAKQTSKEKMQMPDLRKPQQIKPNSPGRVIKSYTPEEWENSETKAKIDQTLKETSEVLKSPTKQRDRDIDPKFTVKPPPGSRDIDPKFTIDSSDALQETNDPMDPRERDKRSAKEKFDALVKKSGKSPTKQTSHGPIKEFHPPMNLNEGPYIVRSKRVPPQAGLDDGPHSKRSKQMQRYQDFVKEGKMNIPSNESNPLDHIFNNPSPTKQADDGSNPKPPKPTSKKQGTKTPPRKPDPYSTKLASGKVISSSEG